MYHVKLYRGENLAVEYAAGDAQDAVSIAYRNIGENPFISAHILKDGTNSGIFIARHTDMDKVSLAQAAELLKDVQWDRPIGR